MIVFEQPHEFNVYAEPPVKWTMRKIGRSVALLAPLIALQMIVAGENAFLKGNFSSAIDLLGMLLAGTLVLSGFVACMLPFNDWALRRIKRILKVKENGVFISHSQRMTIKWSNITAFGFEPAGPRGEWSKLNLEYVFGGRPRNWGMILTDAFQRETLLGELQSRQRAGASFAIEQFTTPQPTRPEPEPRSMLGHQIRVWLFAIGVIALIHGVFFVLAAFSLLPTNSHPQKLNPTAVNYMTKLRANHDMKSLFAGTGIVLIIVGAGAITPSMLSNRRVALLPPAGKT